MVKFVDCHIIGSVFSVFAAWRLGDWKHWEKYYSTIQYFIIGDFLYGLLCNNFPLWSYESPLMGSVFSEIMNALVFYPAMLLIFLPHMPHTRVKQIFYMLLWVGILVLVEAIYYTLGFISYQNGWSIWLSLLFDLVMIPLLWLHYKRPLWAFALLLVCAGIGLALFQVPLEIIK